MEEPSLPEISEALKRTATQDGEVPVGAGRRLAEEEGWRGRLVDVLVLITDDATTMGYLAGGRRPEEVALSLSLWVQSPLSLDDIRLVVASGGWDPEPFVVLASVGLLEAVLRRPDGSPRRVRGELAGGWVSDQLALADDSEILREVRKILENDAG